MMNIKYFISRTHHCLQNLAYITFKLSFLVFFNFIKFQKSSSLFICLFLEDEKKMLKM